MPGQWNGFGNYPNPALPPTGNFAIRSTTTAAGTGNSAPAAGGINLSTPALSSGQVCYSTIINIQASGGDFVAGNYQYLFTAGSPSNAFGNKWTGLNTTIDTKQAYIQGAGANNSITVVNGNYYTMNFENTGYQPTVDAIFMRTTAVPQTFTSVTAAPSAAFISPSTPVLVTATLAGAKTAQENVIIRYSTDGFVTSTYLPTTAGAGNTYTATIPGQSDGLTTSYYALTSTVTDAVIQAQGKPDVYTLRYRNKAAGLPFTYTSSSATANVTFNVDMRFAPVNPAGLFVSGSFNGGATNDPAFQMTQVGSTSVYTLTTLLPQSTTVSFRYANGGTAEAVPGACATAGLRTFTTGTGATTVPTVCYAQCTACGTGATVTFNVDMKFATVSGAGVYVAGTFNGFGPAVFGYLMTQVGVTSVYTLTTTVPENTTYQYKFVNGGSYENVPGACAVSGNRSYAVATGAGGPYIIPTVALTYCNVPAARNVTFRVDMLNEGVVTSASVNGDFNSFAFGATPLTNVSGTLWTATRVFPEGLAISYKYTKNGATFEADAPGSSPCNSNAGPGNRNYVVAAKDTVFSINCFSICGACPFNNNVTFEVDLAFVALGSPLEIRGGFNGFGGGDVLTPFSGTKYRITKSLPSGITYQYKFYNGNFENLDGSVPQLGGNRFFTVPATPNTPLFISNCYNLNGACPAGTNVTFAVNMAEQTVATNVVVAGNFNGFSNSANVLTQTAPGSGIWTGTASVPVGNAINYKFVNGAGTFNFEGNITGSCKDPGSNNRFQLVGNTPVSVPVACWNRCIDCDAANIWTGTTSSNYQNGANWVAGELVLNKDIIVNNGPNNLTVPDNTTATFRSITLNNATIVTGTTASLLQASGNLAGSGFVNGSLVLTGTTQGVAGNITANNLRVNVGSTTTVTGAVRVNNILTVAGAVNVSGGSVALSSTASGTANLAPVTGTYTGNMTVERNISGLPGWYFIGSPMSGAPVISDLKNFPLRIAPRNNANIFEYTEGDTTRGSYNGQVTEVNGWKVPSSLGAALNPGGNPKGYRIYANSAFLNGPYKLFSATGQPNVGNKSSSYTFTPATGFDGGGWNLLVNPYPSELNWNAVATANGASPAALTTWNGTAGGYASWTPPGSSTNGATQFLASSQAYFIKAAAAGSYNFTEAQKSTTNNSFVRAGAIENELKIKASFNGHADEANVVFWSEGSLGQDRYDAPNLAGYFVDIATRPVANVSFAINIMPTLDARYEMPLTLDVSGTGTATLSFSNVESFGSSATIFLKDKFLGTLTDVTTTSSYSFDVSANPATFGADRFTLVFAPASVTGVRENVATTASVQVWPNPATAGSRVLNVGVSHFKGTTATATLMDVTGKVVIRQNMSVSGTQLSLQALPAGTYTLRVQGSEQSAQQRIVLQ